MIASCSGGGLETGNSEEEEDAPAVISDFIYQGASLHNQTDRTGETALHLAARYSRSDAAKRLLEASADANIQDNMGRTPLHAAVSADAQGVFQVGSTASLGPVTLGLWSVASQTSGLTAMDPAVSHSKCDWAGIAGTSTLELHFEGSPGYKGHQAPPVFSEKVVLRHLQGEAGSPYPQ